MTVVEIIEKKTYFLVCYRLCRCYMRYLITFTGQLIVSSAEELRINE